MIAFLLAALFTAGPSGATALPPQDWGTLPRLLLRRPLEATADTSTFVRDEVSHGRCDAAVRDPVGWSLDVDVAVLATADGRVRRVVPRAIRCPTVEQYAAGLVWSGARDNMAAPPTDGERWYRMRVTFAWGA